MHANAGSSPAAGGASLEQIVFAALPPLTARGHAAVLGLIDTCVLGWPADHIAAHLGLVNRHALARLLAAEGLPPYRPLTHWIMILRWVLEWEARGTPLFRQAGDDDRWPRVFRRVLRTRTGMNWMDVRERGAMWVAAQLAEQCVPASGYGHLAQQPQPPSATSADSPSPLPPALKAG